MHESVRVIQGLELEVLNLHETDLDMEWRLLIPDFILKPIQIQTNRYELSKVLDWDPWIHENRSKSKRIGMNRLKNMS